MSSISTAENEPTRIMSTTSSSSEEPITSPTDDIHAARWSFFPPTEKPDTLQTGVVAEEPPEVARPRSDSLGDPASWGIVPRATLEAVHDGGERTKLDKMGARSIGTERKISSQGRYGRSSNKPRKKPPPMSTGMAHGAGWELTTGCSTPEARSNPTPGKIDPSNDPSGEQMHSRPPQIEAHRMSSAGGSITPNSSLFPEGTMPNSTASSLRVPRKVSAPKKQHGVRNSHFEAEHISDTAIRDAVQCGVPEDIAAALKTMDKARAVRELYSVDLVMLAAKHESCGAFAAILAVMLDKLSVHQVSGLLSQAFRVASVEARGSRVGESLGLLSVLLQHGAKPAPQDLILLARVVKRDLLQRCFLEAVSSAKNSFVPSLNIAFALEVAIDEAQEMERRVLIHLRQEVDRMVTEILNWLPQKVRDVSGGMEACDSLFEPRTTEMHAAGCTNCSGPLLGALRCSQRVVTFATTPLGMDFMIQKFTRGLPALTDGERVLALEIPNFDPRDEGKGQERLTAHCQGSKLGGISDRVGKELSCNSLCVFTFLPGAHFIATGIATVTNSYYKVPAMRMALEAIVYVAVLALFTIKGLCHDDGPVGRGEIAFAFWIVAAIIVEVDDMRRDIEEYSLDRWNVPDVLALTICLAAFVVRAFDPESTWGRALYSLGAPLMYWRLLFFAMILPFQGAMIQVVYSMTSELLQFGVVMVVVMLGFAISFFALFRETDDGNFRDSFLNVFKAMLGEVSLFDDFAGSQFDAVGTLLLVSYLIIMSIMLLNLLVAVLSTAHGKLEDNVLIRVSRARMYVHYRWVAQGDSMPPPFNLVQLAVSLPCKAIDVLINSDTCSVARQIIGRATFWLVMGITGVLGGSLLWLLSIPKGLVLIWSAPQARCGWIVSSVKRSVVYIIWSLVGVPLYLGFSWLAQATSVLSGYTEVLKPSTPLPTIEFSVESVLKDATGGRGMSDLRKYLKDPVQNARCCADRSSQDRASTIEHVQLLRKNLETHVKKLERSLGRKLAAITDERINARMDQLEEKLEKILMLLTPPASTR